MFPRAEIVLVIVAIALAGVAITSAVSPRLARWPAAVAATLALMAGVAPLLAFPFLPADPTSERALWEWSAVGGPTIQASYRFDGLAAAGLAVGAIFCGAALIATTRVPSRASLLRPALLTTAFILIAAVVTDDLIAATVVLGALAATTIFVALLVSPAPAVARVAAYLAAGVQAFVVAGLLLARFGGASFRFDLLPPTSLSPGVVLAATAGAALFAGLYPFVPWGYRTEESGERESLRGLLTTPAGVAATVLLVRVVGATRIALPELALPGAIPPPVLALAGLVVLVAARRALARRPRSRGQLVVALVVFGLLIGYPYLRWSHLVLAAALLTVAYAAAVSLALPDQWPVTRYDVTLAAVFIAIATGSPTALAGAFVVLAGAALAALADAFWMPPHRAYLAAVACTTVLVTGTLVIGAGALDVRDIATLVLALAATAAVIALTLVQIGRQLQIAAAPSDLEVASTLFSYLSAVLVAIVLASPVAAALADAFGRPLTRDPETAARGVAALAAAAVLLILAARVVRPFMPDLPPLGTRLGRIIGVADPVPLAAASFRALEATATRASAVFGLFEERAGVWLALLLIVLVLSWTAR